jgi:hypothetical protein
MAWIGRKKVAFVPLFRTNALPPDQVPPDWEGQILRRVLFDPDPATGSDRSLRAYVMAVSSGRADLDAAVLPRESAGQQDVPVDFLEGRHGPALRAQGFDAAAVVMLGGPGAGTAQRGGFWARFVMVEGLGVWAMELMHCLTGFDDLYTFGGNLGGFDEMACACGTHPTAYTKVAVGWLDASAVAVQSARSASHTLHAVGLAQPPPTGRVAAVRVGAQVPYLMVEARLKNDRFDAGIPSEGVIVYRVQTTSPMGSAQNGKAPVDLLTPAALRPGQSFMAAGGVTVRVDVALGGGGFAVHVTRPADARCPALLQQIAGIDELLAEETDLQTKKRLRAQRARLRRQAQQLGCL